MTDFSWLTKHVTFSLDLFRFLGICVNLKKSCLIPTQEIQFIGARLHSIMGKAFLPEDRACSIWALVKRIQCHHSSQALLVQQLLGRIAAAISVVPFAKLNMRSLQIVFLHQFKPHLHAQNWWIRIPSGVSQTLSWWLRPDKVFQDTLSTISAFPYFDNRRFPPWMGCSHRAVTHTRSMVSRGQHVAY